ncbi:50S ribosomal protein L29 [Candidatus Portiera aleyrodidarum]|uniref:Large ribosomal subunit protein uL29 n=2 Tax=Candidatus Portiera aleyrodidarum TaxID=91844 RepID=A0AAU8RPG3_9GAMM|nr:50S ribosomal protein L29 [Candidatus Portiera aleyrodidarum]AFQ24053.1 LSU ribosomal protein L29P [Candidatus Portiera aleyrodidarum BT-B-HRs]AFS18817.1 50S ribosomal protein L29 [Candidatus Portiera aleyrodidarum BT-QVLC]AFT80443.1 ribosomal protein L29 [Candidatus Portiera aleyrodidarum BT-QVLC]AFT80724.1 ribosomal protein L29 [Candidatus Portiera aleyrodidarum BT-B-HRs]AJF24030.1 50S ribosomal protein L29 [Candidatus Portiera aleyrodidarum MED (Bemisia tabaci)]
MLSIMKEEKKIEELNKKVLSLLNKQLKLRMQKRIGQENKMHLLKKIRRDIARLKTRIKEKSVV